MKGPGERNQHDQKEGQFPEYRFRQRPDVRHTRRIRMQEDSQSYYNQRAGEQEYA